MEIESTHYRVKGIASTNWAVNLFILIKIHFRSRFSAIRAHVRLTTRDKSAEATAPGQSTLFLRRQ